MLAVVGVFIDIPFVSNYAFWFAIAAYVIRDWTFNTATAPVLVWIGMISLLVMGARARWGFHTNPPCGQLRFLVRDRCLYDSSFREHTRVYSPTGRSPLRPNGRRPHCRAALAIEMLLR